MDATELTNLRIVIRKEQTGKGNGIKGQPVLTVPGLQRSD